MTRAARHTGALEGMDEFLIRPLRDRDQIRAILEGRRPYAAYALGQLEPALFRLTEWWLSSGARNQALLLHSHGGLGNATFAMGEATALDALLSVHPGQRQTFLTCEVSHLETVLRHFVLEQRQTMIRMQVTPQSFRPSAEMEVRRLKGDDARDINRLYRTDGVPSFYSGRQIDDSVYFGVERDGPRPMRSGSRPAARLSPLPDSPELARRLGLTGLAGRASGQAFDLRCDLPCAPYSEVAVEKIGRTAGDVASRVAVRFDELQESARLIERLLSGLPDLPRQATSLRMFFPLLLSWLSRQRWPKRRVCLIQVDSNSA